MANHRRDEGGKEWAKATTISLLKRLACVTGLTKKQIECDLGIAVANTDKDRCTLPTGDAVVKALNSKRSAFSLQRLSSIVGSAYERGWLDDRDLHDLRLVDASIGAALRNSTMPTQRLITCSWTVSNDFAAVKRHSLREGPKEADQAS